MAYNYSHYGSGNYYYDAGTGNDPASSPALSGAYQAGPHSEASAEANTVRRLKKVKERLNRYFFNGIGGFFTAHTLWIITSPDHYPQFSYGSQLNTSVSAVNA
ncbi:hypothetical protein H0H92_002388 [Tricholoma furcatifolium]|nr:hypothetical protein H0H92_002388 [Tricholoma furcatifolium]